VPTVFLTVTFPHTYSR